MRSRPAILAFALLAAAGCARDPASSGPRPPTTVSTPPVAGSAPAASESKLEAAKRQPPGEPCDTSELMPADMVLDNIANTELSGIGEIVSASVSSTDGSSAVPTKGYANLTYELRLLRQFSGSKQERLKLSLGVEAPAKPRPAGTLVFFSACSSAPGTAYEPDVGYVVYIEASCQAEVEARAAKAAPPKAGSPASACQP